MTHHHIIPATDFESPIASLRYEAYSDAIETFVSLSNMMLGHRAVPGEFSLENAVKATESGLSGGAFAGNKTLGLYFLTCHGDDACWSSTWN